MAIRKRFLKEKGFTLIELMLVISIILVLMRFMVPKFSTYHNKVKETKAINIAKQIQTAAMASYGDNEGKFVKNDVSNNITGLTAAEVIETNVLTDDQNLQVDYKSDKKKYTLIIDANTNTITLKDSEKSILPQVQVNESK